LHFCEESASYLCLNFVYFITVAKYYFPLPLLGTGDATKTDEFSVKFETAFAPDPPHFQKIILQFFSENHAQKALFKGAKSASKSLGLKMTPPPPFGTFPKIQAFW